VLLLDSSELFGFVCLLLVDLGLVFSVLSSIEYLSLIAKIKLSLVESLFSQCRYLLIGLDR